jgi:hypothetical protein
MKKIGLLIISAFAVFYISGCGYTTGSLLPSHLKTIYIDDFKNSIDLSREPSDKHGAILYRPGVENDITQAVIDQFIFDGNLRIASKDDADLVLTGKIVDYYKQPLRYDKFDNVEEFRVIVTVDMKLYDEIKGTVMWDVDGFIGYDSYRLTGAFATDEEAARDGAIKDLAEKIVEKAVEVW